MEIHGKTKREAISPIIATVLIIAVTLIAAVAIGGFVFGLFGASSSTAQVQAVGSSVSHLLTVGTAWATCSAAQGANGYVQFTNTGTANTLLSSVSLTYGGNTYSLAVSGAACTVTAGGAATYVQISNLPSATGATAGSQYTGFVVTGNGAQVIFTGAFT